MSALCNYGGSLKAIPKQENVSLVLTDAVKTEHGQQDRFYVFTRQDLSDCQAEKLSVTQLKDRALRYDF